MFYNDETERDILHQSTSKTPYNKGNKPLINRKYYNRRKWNQEK